VGGAPVPRLVIMGPSGCGKTTIARALAQSLHCRFVEGDELHPPANVEKMQAGIPLDDADRAPWLDAVARAVAQDSGKGVVAACSALKRQYRDRLRGLAGPLFFILPRVSRDALAQRMISRSGHYMPPALLASQLADLELLAEDEEGLCIDGAAALSAQVDCIRSRLGQ
jgi:carbohydrate kinase (thermoresistant glucokinase family)